LRVIFTVTPSKEDRITLDEIMEQLPCSVTAFPEPFTFNQLAAAISMTELYVGMDTVVSHVAASVGVNVIALFGPTFTRYWAPWPHECSVISPFAKNKGIQRQGNITIVQKDWECIPCNRETCSISNRDKIKCLAAITPEEVFMEIIERVK
jgi:heptosyltransferase-3